MLRTLILLSALFLAGCTPDKTHQSQNYVFGTLVDITIYGESDKRAEALTNHVQQEFQRLHDSLHAWKPGSDLSKLNDAFAAGKKISIAPELTMLVNDATRISQQSDGLFNPAIGGLIHLWGFQRDDFSPVRPDPQIIKSLVAANPRMSDIVIEGGTAWSRNPTVKLDLGGYAKGYALDLAAQYLRKEKVHGALINIGGNIMAIGQHGDRPWRVGIQHPRKPQPVATLDLADGWAIGTSGDYQRYFELDGKRYCHIINPNTGFPATGVQAVTVLIPPGKHAGAWSDAASKPLFLAGQEHWLQTAQKLGLQYAMLIDDQGRIHLTTDMQKKIRLEPAK
jgi:thiamine biosynthesis lipoprotein